MSYLQNSGLVDVTIDRLKVTVGGSTGDFVGIVEMLYIDH